MKIFSSPLSTIWTYLDLRGLAVLPVVEVFLNMLDYAPGDLEREPCDETWLLDSTHWYWLLLAQ